MRSISLILLSVVFLFSCSQKKPETLFTSIETDISGVDFTNHLEETPDFNIIEYLYFYNGGGVALGDIDNDGLVDVYLSSNQQPNRLYLNEGNFHFRDISSTAGVPGLGNWKTGVAMVDINGDGLLDIFSCGVGGYKKFVSANQVYINNGNRSFTERSKELGLAFQGFSTQYAFLDYDLDGDLDIYLLNHSVHTQRSLGNAKDRLRSDSLSGDVLYRNELIPSGTLNFTNVTKQAGIYNSSLGYGLGVGVSDLNDDGYPDLYISNDFSENDYLYMNNGDGSFRDATQESLRHTSRFSMGNDIADLNNDLFPDLVTVDMKPTDESVIKTTTGEDNYEIWKYKLQHGFQTQVSRNTVQLNTGPMDSGKIDFCDIAQISGLEATDWSWCPLIFDFDGDGLKDIFVSNGILRRPNDLDYINFISTDSAQRKMAENSLPWIKLMPEGKAANYLFQNLNGMQFRNVSSGSGLNSSDWATGAAIGDLNSDGVPDLVVNRINDNALILRNNSSPDKFFKVSLAGDPSTFNSKAVGSKISIENSSEAQVYELYPTRGWQSSSDHSISFGSNSDADSLVLKIVWPDGLSQYEKIKNHFTKISYKPNRQIGKAPTLSKENIFKNEGPIPFTHHENEFNAFNREGLIPYMLTTEGPPLAAGDVNNDGLDDFFVGGGKGQAGELFLQGKDNKFSRTTNSNFRETIESEEVDAAFFDADGDSDLDLVIVSGGQEDQNVPALTPKLFINENGKFSFSSTSFPRIFPNASCVKAVDYDQDGDVDLFIGSSALPYLYGISPPCYLLDNNGKGEFDLNENWLGDSTFDNPTKVRPGMVKDATWTDLNRDGLVDLVLVGNWMPITVLLQNKDHQFSNATYQLGLGNTRGWWNSIQSADLDRDGDDDLIVGNLGLNTRLKSSVKEPLQMYLGDFDSNSGSDHIIVYYNDSKRYPFANRDDIVKQMPSLKKKFLRYTDFRDVALEDLITPIQIGNSALMKTDMFESIVLINEREKFKLIVLPVEAQVTPVYSIVPYDFNHDNNLDLLLGGNLLATQPEIGPLDAGVGVLLKGNSSGEFKALSPRESGFLVVGEIRDMKVIKSGGKNFLIVSRNNNSIIYFSY